MRGTDPQRLFLREQRGNAGDLRESADPERLLLKSNADRTFPITESPAARRGFMTSPAKYGGMRANALRSLANDNPDASLVDVPDGEALVIEARPRRSLLPALVLALAIGAVVYLGKKG